MAKDKEIERFKRDAKAFGKSAAGHIPGVGKLLGIHDTVHKGNRLVKSGSKAANTIKRRIKSKINRKLRKFR